MIYIENLTVKLPKVEALKNINLEVKAGQRLGLVGESGSGKTMLGLSLLGITPDPAINSGILKINNLNIDIMLRILLCLVALQVQLLQV